MPDENYFAPATPEHSEMLMRAFPKKCEACEKKDKLIADLERQVDRLESQLVDYTCLERQVDRLESQLVDYT